MTKEEEEELRRRIQKQEQADEELIGAPQPEEELLYPEQGMQFGGTGSSLFGTQPTDGGVDPTVLAGLGLGGGIVAAGTGGQAATSQVLSPFAQRVAAQDAARQSAAAAQARVNNRIIGSNMPAGGANPTVTGSVKPGTLQNPSNIIGRNLPSGGANPQVTGRVRPGTLGSMARPAAGLAALGGAGAFSTTVAPATAALIGGYLGGKAVDNLGGDAMRGLGLTERDGSMATMAGEIIGEGLYGDGNLSAFSPEESASSGRYQQRQGELDRREPSIASDQIATPEVRAGRSQQRQGEQSQLSGFFEPGGFGYEYLGGRLGDTIGQFVGEQKYGTGLDVEGGVTGRPLNPRGLPGQTATLGANALELLGAYGIDPVVTAAQGLPEYVTGLDLTDSSLIDTPTAEVPEAQTAIPQIPQGAPGSPQAFFEEYRSKGPLTPEQISRGEAAAARMGTTFDPNLGFSREPFLAAAKSAPVTSGLVTQSGIPLSEFLSGAAIPSAGLRAESPMYADDSMSRGFTGDAGRAAYEDASEERDARLVARMQQPGESITERDTRNAAARTQSSQNVPTDVREAMLTPEGRRTAKQINRLARWSGSTQGQEMGGVAGLEQILQPVDVDPQQQQYDEMRLYKLGLEIEKMQKEKPTEYQEAAAAVDEAISAGDITPGKRSNAILSKLGYDLEELLGSGLNGGGNVFNTVEEAEAANLPPGTQVTIGGKKAIIE